jgi:hypothetical protein
LYQESPRKLAGIAQKLGKRRKVTMAPNFALLEKELEDRVMSRTGRRLRNLGIELFPERVVLRGQTSTYHVKQLAQQEVLDFLPGRRLENAIEVRGAE